MVYEYSARFQFSADDEVKKQVKSWRRKRLPRLTSFFFVPIMAVMIPMGKLGGFLSWKSRK